MVKFSFALNVYIWGQVCCCLNIQAKTYLYILSSFSAVCPYLAFETCRQWRLSTKTVNLMRNGKMPTVTIEQAQKNFCKVCIFGESMLTKLLFPGWHFKKAHRRYILLVEFRASEVPFLFTYITVW